MRRKPIVILSRLVEIGDKLEERLGAHILSTEDGIAQNVVVLSNVCVGRAQAMHMFNKPVIHHFHWDTVKVRVI